MEKRILKCPNKVCADAYRKPLEYMKEDTMDDAKFDRATEALIRWKQVGSQYSRCVKPQADHKQSGIYQKLTRAKKTFQDAFGLLGDKSMHLVFQSENE